MSLSRSISARLEDLKDGPIGSPQWIEARGNRFLGKLQPFEDNDQWRALRSSCAVARGNFVGPVRPPILGVKPAQPPRPFVDHPEKALGDSGRIEPIADFDDSDHFTTPLDDAPRIKLIQDAERVYQRICSDECGKVIPPEKNAKKRREKAVLLAQSHAIARKLELGKVHAYNKSDWTLWVYGVHSGEVEEMPKFRRIAFLPTVAASIREPFVRELEYYLQGNEYARFWTLTGGKRVLLCEVRRAIQRLSKRIRKLNNQPFMHEAGVRIIFRTTELGTVERHRKGKGKGQGVDLLDEKGELAGGLERDEKGRLWFHPHAHCLIELEKGRLPHAEWCTFLEKVRAYWKDWMDDAGVIRSAREAVKYVTKPGEIQHLSSAETVALFEQLRRLKIVQPLGTLAEAIKAREAAGLHLVRQSTHDGSIWIEEPNHNRGGKVDKTKHRVSVRVQGDDFIGPECADLSERDMKAAARLRTSADKADVDACVVVARCSPSAARNGVKEPRVVVMGKRFDRARIEAHPLVNRIWQATYDQWQAGLAVIRVHTGTPSVPTTPVPRRGGPSSPAWRRHFERLKALPTLT